MNTDLIREYLEQTAMEPAQAQALSRIFAEMATKSDLVALDAKLTGQMVELRSDMMVQMAQMESRLTWRTIAIVGFFATVSTLLNAFVG